MPGPAPPLERRAEGRVGTTVRGKYRIERLLGVGGMAAVYQAVHRNGHRVALKLLHPELSLRSDVCARFLREGYLANRVGHAGAVRVLDDDVAEDGAAFLVMELLSGETLRARCQRAGGRLPCREVLALGRQLLDVLSAAHAAGIVHRDVKPDNLFITGDRVLKVLDFGIARLEDDGGALATVAGTRLGTPAFMPPELALGRTEEIDGRTDLWSVGATLFQLLSGHIVHEAGTAAEIMVRAATVPPRSLASAAPEVPPPVVALVDRALAFAREDRWPSARAMAEALEAAHAAVFGEPVAPTAIADVPEEKVEPPARWGSTGDRGGGAPRVDAEAETVDAAASTGAARATAPASTSTPPEARPTVASGSAPPAPGSPAAAEAPTRSGISSTVAEPAAIPPRARSRLTPWIALLVASVAAISGGAALLRGRSGPGGYAAAGPAAPSPASPCPAGMVAIPGGAFEMGEAGGRPDEQPVHHVEVASFCLDVDEITVGKYAGCAASRGCPQVPVTVERPDLSDADRLLESAACNGTRGERISHPVNCVDHAAATHYCASLGLRLPTEEEWEYAARGGAEQRRYPWGDADPDATRLNACDRSCFDLFTREGRPWGYMIDAPDGFPSTAPVGSFRAGDSRFGVHDMAGNVIEWTSSPYCPYPANRCDSPYRVYRGGGWPAVLRTTVQTGWRGFALPSVRDSDLGFRCAKSLGEAVR